MSFGIDDQKLLQKYKVAWAKTEDLKNIILNILLVYDDRYIKTKIRSHGDQGYTNVCGLNVPEEDTECESFTVISMRLIIFSKYSKFNVDCKTAIKNWENVSNLSDNCIWIGSGKFSLLLREYL